MYRRESARLEVRRGGRAAAAGSLEVRFRHMPAFMWDVLLPGEDLPRRVTTDYLLSEGEELTLDGRAWLIERVEIDASIEDASGIVAVVPPHDPV